MCPEGNECQGDCGEGLEEGLGEAERRVAAVAGGQTEQNSRGVCVALGLDSYISEGPISPPWALTSPLRGELQAVDYGDGECESNLDNIFRKFLQWQKVVVIPAKTRQSECRAGAPGRVSG